MAKVVQFPKTIDGLSAGDRRAIALHEWLVAQTEKYGHATNSAMKDEIDRLMLLIPDDVGGSRE